MADDATKELLKEWGFESEIESFKGKQFKMLLPTVFLHIYNKIFKTKVLKLF